MNASDLLISLGGIRHCAEEWNVSFFSLRQAAYRNKLPVKLWPRILDSCKKKGVQWSAEDLMWLWIRGKQ